MFIKNKIVSCLSLGFGGSLAFLGICTFKGDDKFYLQILMPAIHKTLDAESAHRFAIRMAELGVVPRSRSRHTKQSLLETTLWGIKFNNPIGLAAGFDKDGRAINGLAKMGFGFVEVGSVTPEPQEGNEKPRVFRLVEDYAVINRYGFNSAGCEAVKENIKKQENKLKGTVVGVNLGKNKLVKNAEEDYSKGLLAFAELDSIDYFVVNISSPNTPFLRNLQCKKELNQLIEKILQVKADKKINKPLLIKLAPDLTNKELQDIADVINRFSKNQTRIDGIIISNTTIDRPGVLKSDIELVLQDGGLSGAPLRQMSTEVIKKMYKLTGGRVPIVGVGGVFNGKDAFEKIKAGASLIQIYTSLVYEGPPVVGKIKKELADLLIADGFKNVSEAVGKDHR